MSMYTSMYAIDQAAGYGSLAPASGDAVVTDDPVIIPTPPRLRLVENRSTAPARRRRRVFWRRRLVVVLAVTTLVLVANSVRSRGGEERGAGAPPAARAMAPVSQDTYVVQPGDSLWGIARRAQPRGDVRPLVHRLASLRQGRPLQVGDRIAVP